jgi:pilus assembly protein TadC
MAGMKKKPEEYVQSCIKAGFLYGFAGLAISFFLLSKDEPNFVTPLLVGIFVGYFMFMLSSKKVDLAITKRAREIDKEVLFAGRFLLIKLNSGKPLINALEEASQGFGAATEHFRTIMRDIELGAPLEQALDRGTEFCPSKNLKKILFQITNALKIGVDVTNFLQAILDDIAEEQLNEILRYGKKLSSLTMFYMLIAIIVPSLGMTLFIVIAGLVSIQLDMISFFVILVLLGFIQFLFISLFKSARPNMDV